MYYNNTYCQTIKNVCKNGRNYNNYIIIIHVHTYKIFYYLLVHNIFIKEEKKKDLNTIEIHEEVRIK